MTLLTLMQLRSDDSHSVDVHVSSSMLSCYPARWEEGGVRTHELVNKE